MTPLSAYWALFSSALTSATILPGTSEAVLLGFLIAEIGDPVLLVAVAWAGNLIGSLISYGMGRYASLYRDRRWFPISTAQYDKAMGWYGKYGLWTLLFAWFPVIGDPLTVIAGAMRAPLIVAVPLIAVGKLGRYLFIAAGYALWSV